MYNSVKLIYITVYFHYNYFHFVVFYVFIFTNKINVMTIGLPLSNFVVVNTEAETGNTGYNSGSIFFLMLSELYQLWEFVFLQYLCLFFFKGFWLNFIYPQLSNSK
jgi:hypothetical protein